MAKAYLLSNGRYVRYDTDADRVDADYPKALSAGWTNLPEAFTSDLDAALDLAGGKVYLFKGAEYVRVDQQSNTVDPGYPVLIADFWPGLAEAGFGAHLDAAVTWNNGKAYFFRGDHYLGYDLNADHADPHPKLIAGNWPGVAEVGFGDGINAAVTWNNGKAYFFRGDHYLGYDLNADHADPEPKPIAGNWPGVAEAGFGGRVDAAWLKLAQRTGPAASGDEHGGWARAHDVLHVGGTLAWRNNNPGNLLPGRMPYRNALAVDRRGLAIFASHEDGWTALRGVLRSSVYNPLSMGDALMKYAPSGHGNNDPVLYAKRVRQLTGLDPARRVADLDDAELESFMLAIKTVEGFEEGRTFQRTDPSLPPEFAALFP
ncbi:hemopexin repeat-containing protein [Nonomuraea glycinis]|uniref:hemopexin repeat-containing protein n=1 Tax=Nonomuraea glycinis TaxID=2047744 RepID=UPI0033BA47B6